MFRDQLTDFGAFYERTYANSYRTALGVVREPALAADVTQDAYVSAYRQRERFRGDAPADAWLLRIVVNTAISSLRRRTIRWLEPLDAGTAAPSGAVTGGSLDRMALDAGMRALSPQARAAIVLRYYHDYDYDTIAHVLGTTRTNVGSLLSRALDRMRAELEGTGGSERAALREADRHG